ncbi:GFA family protein [Chelativorans composti]|jgi:Uncharacterized conserved protein|uniref:GFA family protein n=1 Tax=Chelativorans composti TaxID=768533 RepID=A0ABW5DF45_9HYPH
MQYQGGCHCNAVRFRVEVDLSNPVTCNCSYCTKRGSILAFTPEQNFVLESGEDKLTEYRFNTRTIAHLFCSVCGMESFSRGELPDGRRMVAVNLRCLDGVDPQSLNPTMVDGRSR